MNASCTICFEMFEEHGIVATKCGHVFHGRCIEKWIGNSAKVCPECRASVTKMDFTKLYLHTSKNDSLPDYSTVKNELETSKADVLAMQSGLKAANTKISQLQKHAKTCEREKMKYYDSCNTLTKENHILKLQLKEVHSLNTQISDLQTENIRLESQVNHFNKIEVLLNCTRKEADEIFHQYCLKDITRHTAEEMASMMSVLRHEMQNMKERKNVLEHEKNALLRKLGVITAQHKKLLDSHEELKQQLSSLEESPRPVMIFSSGAGPEFSATSEPNNEQAPSTSAAVDHKKLELSPITPISYERTTPIMKRVIINNSMAPTKVRQSLMSVAMKRKQDEDDKESITRVGYNGLGCHERVVLPRKMQQFATSKPYKKNPNVKRAK